MTPINQDQEKNHPSTMEEERPRRGPEDESVPVAWRRQEEPIWETERPSWLLILLRALSAWNT